MIVLITPIVILNILPCLPRYLISQGASVGVVNSEGETPLDIAEEEAMEELLQNEINRQGTALTHILQPLQTSSFLTMTCCTAYCQV